MRDWEAPEWCIAVIAALAVIVGSFCAYDCYGGHWQDFHGKMMGQQFVPDRSYWATEMRCQSDGKNGSTCTSELVYHSVPPEYHVFVMEDGGESDDFDDAWAFSRFERGQFVRIVARIGGVTGTRYLPHITQVGSADRP